MNLNFNKTTIAEIYSNEIPRHRAEELAGILKREANIMIDQHNSYTAMVDDGDGAGEQLCVHRGKVMQRLLEFTNNEYERMFIAHSMEVVVQFLNRSISNKIFRQIKEKLR